MRNIIAIWCKKIDNSGSLKLSMQNNNEELLDNKKNKKVEKYKNKQ